MYEAKDFKIGMVLRYVRMSRNGLIAIVTNINSCTIEVRRSELDNIYSGVHSRGSFKTPIEKNKIEIIG